MLLRVIPVLDILNGVAVHGVRGERKDYRPLKSILCTSANPLDLARAFRSFGFNDLYVADLDAILGKCANLTVYKQIRAETGLDLMVDAGINNIEKAEKVLENGASQIIIGTETLEDLDFVKEAAESLGKDRIIVSIDLKDGKVLSKSGNIRSKNPAVLVETLERTGITRIIILDLTRVGSEMGVNLSIVQAVLNKTEVEVFIGGGVRGIEDLEELRSIGVSAALVATVLHTGKIAVKELKLRRFL